MGSNPTPLILILCLRSIVVLRYLGKVEVAGAIPAGGFLPLSQDFNLKKGSFLYQIIIIVFMKQFILLLATICILISGCSSESVNTGEEDLTGNAIGDFSKRLTQIEAKYVCMVNDDSYLSEQILVQVEGKDYYGCCMGCKAKLENDPSQRSAIDPVSGNSIDKATAVIGADPSGTIYYFENLENLQEYGN